MNKYATVVKAGYFLRCMNVITIFKKENISLVIKKFSGYVIALECRKNKKDHLNYFIVIKSICHKVTHDGEKIVTFRSYMKDKFTVVFYADSIHINGNCFMASISLTESEIDEAKKKIENFSRKFWRGERK